MTDQEDKRRADALPEWKVRRIQKLRREGLTYEAIGERMGVHRNTAYLAAKRGGLVVEVRCVSCGRRTWRRAPGPEATARPVVCDSCKPRWRNKLRFNGRTAP